jgi:hypothetical protein
MLMMETVIMRHFARPFPCAFPILVVSGQILQFM